MTGNKITHLLHCVGTASLLFVFALSPQTLAKPLQAKDVLVIYNSSLAESQEIAEFYAVKRGIPKGQLLGLKLSVQQDISRDEYESSLAKPIQRLFSEKAWWSRRRQADGVKFATKNKIAAIVLMRGVPLRITPDSIKKAATPGNPFNSRDEAAVDSELMRVGIDGLTNYGILSNPFFESESHATKKEIPYVFMVTRIDGPDYETCRRIIRDSIETEKTGLWGRSYVDTANKVPEGDGWLESIIKQNTSIGLPTFVDHFKQTLPRNFPASEAATYYGWYDWHVSGPFLNPEFKFKPGAIAVHIHSFSAMQINDTTRNWVAPLLARGVAATLGNVYEPYLGTSHHLDIFHDRLLRGWTFAEASTAAMPVMSWQGIAIGDPLYQPFLHLNSTGKVTDRDRPFRVFRAAMREWEKNPAKKKQKLHLAAKKMSSGILLEAIASESYNTAKYKEARAELLEASELYSMHEDKIRLSLQLVMLEMKLNRLDKAVKQLETTISLYPDSPAIHSAKTWLKALKPREAN